MILKYKKLRAWLGQAGDLAMLLAVFAIILGAWTFIELADEVREGETRRIDEAVLLALREPAAPADPIGPPWLEEFIRDMTALGGIPVLFLITTIVAVYLLLLRQFQALGLLLAATLGGWLINSVLKGFFMRPRPELVAHLSQVNSSSFPSGHSMMAAVTYLTLGALLARIVKPFRLRIYFLVVALTLTLLVGFSRIYLGVHYPSDVLAGWAAGLFWAVLCWLVARALERRGKWRKL